MASRVGVRLRRSARSAVPSAHSEHNGRDDHPFACGPEPFFWAEAPLVSRCSAGGQESCLWAEALLAGLGPALWAEALLCGPKPCFVDRSHACGPEPCFRGAQHAYRERGRLPVSAIEGVRGDQEALRGAKESART